ncbi:MAG TPA: trehalase-like domain-containing protein [Polyangia bacterium]|nr:trehalase-like domain-containing protein [Polyangia bacterium]
MDRRIEDHALIGDTQAAALVSNEGSIDWACLPRFDSGACFSCTQWLADVYVQMGQNEKAAALFERVTGAANDLGLLSEEYDPGGRRLLGNFPQALTHLAVINTAFNLTGDSSSPAQHRRSVDPR